MIIDLAEVKVYLKTNFTFEDEKVLEETAKGLKEVLENTVYGGIAYNGNVYSPYQKKKVEQLETDEKEKEALNDSLANKGE